MPDITVPIETAEFVHVPLYDEDGVLITDFETAVTRWPARPTTWTAAVQRGTEYGASIAGLTRGTWQVWARTSGTVTEIGSIWVEGPPA